MKYNIELLKKYIDDGLLKCQSHPTLPLKIYNYTRECQYDKKWDEITLSMRGTVLDNEGNLIAKSFDKFFNLSEFKTIPNDTFDVYDKMDGSLLIMFNYNGEWVFASKGSFTSEHSKRGFEIFKEKYSNVKLFDDIVYIFEIIFNENRIVVKYPFEDLFLLGAWYRKIERELDIYTGIFDGLNRVKKYNGLTDIDNLKNLIGENQEGFVIQFHKSGIRAKIKSDEYIRLHSLLTNFSNIDIWECLRNKIDFNEFLDRTPDEFDFWVKNIKNNLERYYKQIEGDAIQLFNDYKQKRSDFIFENNGKKEYAMWVKEQPKQIQSVLFNLFDGKDYSKVIWGMIRPKYQKPFWVKDVD